MKNKKNENDKTNTNTNTNTDIYIKIKEKTNNELHDKIDSHGSQVILPRPDYNGSNG